MSRSKIFLTYASLILIISATLVAVRFQNKYVHTVFMCFVGCSLLVANVFLFMYEYSPVTAVCRTNGCARTRSLSC